MEPSLEHICSSQIERGINDFPIKLFCFIFDFSIFLYLHQMQEVEGKRIEVLDTNKELNTL